MSVSIRQPSGEGVSERQWVRRAELLDAARRVFEKGGYHAATVSAIVRVAGLSQGAFYLYFADKKGIFAALQDEMATLLRRRIYWATRGELDARRRLEAGLRAYFEFYDEYPAYNRRLTIEGLGIDPGFEARQTALHQTLATAFEPTLQQLGVRAAAIAAFGLLGMAAQLAYWQHFQREPQPGPGAAALARACTHLFLDGAAAIPTPLSLEGGPHA